jgi:hypothetical protein
LHLIRETLASSVRSHYSCQDIQKLFDLRERAAQKILECFPSLPLGRSKLRLVSRESLLDFVVRAGTTEDIPGLLAQIKAESAAKPSRKAIASLPSEIVARDRPVVRADALPAPIELERGCLRIQFETLDVLVAALQTLAQALSDDTDGFASA